MSPLVIDRIVRETFVVEVEHHIEITSTNDRAVQRAKQGANKLPLMVIADRQTAGRGRGSNRWWTGSGSLAFSLLFDSKTIDTNNGSMPLVSLTAGLAVVETIKPLLPNHEVGINWPNDVVAGGHKLAGILVEVLPGQKTIIGIGINTNNAMADAPAELLPIATTLLDLTGAEHDHTAILVSLLSRLERHLVTLKQDPPQVAAQADALCLQRGKNLTLQTGSQSVTGVCSGIAPDGALLLETAYGLRTFYSGVVVLS
ncbi:MAG TPA: biotin--[acetyl-CoA-carboxylase] ligase [Thermoguttaceae bacterium]